MERKTTYLALTTTNYDCYGYDCIVTGNNKDDVRAKAKEIIGDVSYSCGVCVCRDVCKTRDTKHKNLIVVSKTKAKKLGVNHDSVNFNNNHNPAVISSQTK